MTELSNAVAQLSHDRRVQLENSLLDGKASSRLSDIPKLNSSDGVPLTFAQWQLWYLAKINPRSTAYNQMQVMQLSGLLDVPALQRSIDTLSTRHDSLRLCIHQRNGQPVQITGALSECAFTTLTLKHSSITAQRTAAWRFTEQWRSQPFKLYDAPLWRMRLIRFNDKEHWLVRVCHHIISDGWSNGLYWQELAHAYTAWANDQPPVFVPLPIRYTDFSVWQRNWLQGETMDRLVNYWRQRLAGLETLQLPTDHPRTRQANTDGKLYTFSLPPILAEAVYSLARAQGATLYMLLLSSFQVLLHRYTGQDDIAIGSLVANRSRPETEGLYGLFINALVMRADCTDDPEFSELLANTKYHVLDAFEHQALPFEKLVEVLNPERDPARNPLFDVLFTLQNMPKSEWTLPGLSCQRLTPTKLPVKFDLSLAVYETSTGMTCQIEYASALFEEPSIVRMARHFNILLTSITQNPKQRLSQLPILGQEELQQLRFGWNATTIIHDLSLNLVQLFELQASATPYRVALITDEVSISYEQLNSRANQLAHHLLAKGLKAQQVVGVHLGRSVDVTIALLAIYKLRSVYLPLDASYPAARLAMMFNVSQADMLITRADMESPLELTNQPRVQLDTHEPLLLKLPTGNPGTMGQPDDLAYIIFTSGSTASPKGVCVSHRQILNRMHWMWRCYPFGENDVSCQKTAISFVDSLWEILGPLLMGSPSVVLTDTIIFNPVSFLDCLQRHQVSRLWVVPTLLQLLIDTAVKSAHALPALKMIVSSGETLSGALAAQVRHVWPHARLYNLYGTSEAWDSTWHPVTREDERALQVPVGKPIDNVKIHILDAQLSPVPIGVAGQLYVSGPGLADHFIQGGNGQTDVFVDQPWIGNTDNHDDTRMHASGDRARYTSDGIVELLGRENDELNIRGYRVNPAEIEQTLMSLPEVDHAVIVQTSALGRAQLLVAFVTLPLVKCQGKAHSSMRELKAQLHGHLKRQLASYMLPNHYVLLDTLPTTSSGKLNRRALTLEADKALLDQDYQDNESSQVNTDSGACTGQQSDKKQADNSVNITELEQRILQIWTSILPGRTISVDDDFFDVGGHSLLAVELFDKLQPLADTPLELTSLLDASTVSEQAQLITQLTNHSEHSKVVTIRASGSASPLYMIPPSAGTGLNYRSLSASLGEDQPVFTFNLSSPRRTNVALNEDASTDSNGGVTVESIAREFVTALTQKHPNGPYVVGGKCFGGIVAWEMTRQLQNAGAHVNSLILLDSSLPKTGPGWHVPASAINRTLYQTLAANARFLIENRANLESLGRVYHKAMQRVLRMWNTRLREFNIMRVEQYRAWQLYEAQPLQTDVLMICTAEFIAHNHHYTEKWESLVQGAMTLEVLEDVTHLEMLTDTNRHIPYIGRLIHRYLNSSKNAGQN